LNTIPNLEEAQKINSEETDIDEDLNDPFLSVLLKTHNFPMCKSKL